MGYKSITKDIIFIEGQFDDCQRITKIHYDKSFWNEQSRGLNNVKEQLAHKAKILGANAVVDFKYGQKSSGWFKSILFASDDDVAWYGEGYAAIISPEKYNEICDKIKNQ